MDRLPPPPACATDSRIGSDPPRPRGLTPPRPSSGDDTGGAPPLPIPNTAVKPPGPMIVPLARKSVIPRSPTNHPPPPPHPGVAGGGGFFSPPPPPPPRPTPPPRPPHPGVGGGLVSCAPPRPPPSGPAAPFVRVRRRPHARPSRHPRPRRRSRVIVPDDADAAAHLA